MKFLFTRSAANKRPWAILLMLGAFLLLMRTISTPGSGQSPTTQSNLESRNERVLVNAIPKHVPITVKVKSEKEKGFKDLRNEKWAREFELEVTNTGDKPIYSLSLLLVTDVKAAAGNRIVAPLVYGRAELGDIRSTPQPTDVPIKPGDTYIFKIHSGQLEAWEILRRKENRPFPRSIQVEFVAMNFGDGTGYIGDDGEALPHTPNEQSRGRCVDPPNKDGPGIIERLSQKPNGTRISLSDELPAALLPVKFLLRELPEEVSLNADPPVQDCCPGFECTRVVFQLDQVLSVARPKTDM